LQGAGGKVGCSRCRTELQQTQPENAGVIGCSMQPCLIPFSPNTRQRRKKVPHALPS
jgi:hypothetical protein